LAPGTARRGTIRRRGRPITAAPGAGAMARSFSVRFSDSIASADAGGTPSTSDEPSTTPVATAYPRARGKRNSTNTRRYCTSNDFLLRAAKPFFENLFYKNINCRNYVETFMVERSRLPRGSRPRATTPPEYTAIERGHYQGAASPPTGRSGRDWQLLPTCRRLAGFTASSAQTQPQGSIIFYAS